MKSILERIIAAWFIMRELKKPNDHGIKVLSCEYDVHRNEINYTAVLPGKIHNIDCEITLSE